MWRPFTLPNDKSNAAQQGTGCAVKVTPEQGEIRGLAWVIGAFLICPCHLPLTLGLAATLLSGTAAAALLHDHPYVAGPIISLVWLAATWARHSPYSTYVSLVEAPPPSL